MTLPTCEHLYDVIDVTWPAAEKIHLGPWTLRRGLGGGSRVSATTGQGTSEDIPSAEAAMRGMGQPCLFMIQKGQQSLDTLLGQRGYQVKDPVTLYAAPIDLIATHRPPPVTTFEVWPPLAVQAELWAEGGIHRERLNVMERADCHRTTILGRLDDTPAGTGYIGIHDSIAMFHALEVSPKFRRRGLAVSMVRAMAFWAKSQGATHMALVVTQANIGANALYSSLGFEAVGHYHYRHLPE